MSLSWGAVLFCLGGFPKVQFTSAPGGRFGVFVNITLSKPDAFTHQGIISCHIYRMPPSCLENSSVRFSEVLMHSSYTHSQVKRAGVPQINKED